VSPNTGPGGAYLQQIEVHVFAVALRYFISHLPRGRLLNGLFAPAPGDRSRDVINAMLIQQAVTRGLAERLL